MKDKFEKINKYRHLVDELRRQYPDYPSTFNICSIESCNNWARGVGMCSECIEIGLQHLVGMDNARQLHDAIKLQHKINYEIGEMLYDEISRIND